MVAFSSQVLDLERADGIFISIYLAITLNYHYQRMLFELLRMSVTHIRFNSLEMKFT